MRRIILFKKVILMLILIILSNLCEAQFSGLTIGAIISKLEKSANNIIEKAGEEARTTIMFGSQQAQLHIENLKAAYDDSLEETFDELDEAKQKIFTDANVLINNLNNGVYKSVSELKVIAENIDESMTRIPFFEKFPRLREPAEVFFLKLSNDDFLNLTLQGSRLDIYGDEYKPYLLVNGEKNEPIGSGSALQFSIPLRNFQMPDEKVKIETVTLVVYHKETKYLIWSTYVERKFNITLFSLPRILGTYKVNILEKTMEKKVHSHKTGGYQCQSGRTSDRICNKLVTVPVGHRLIHSSPVFNVTRKEENSYYEFNNVTDAGFTLKLVAKTASTNPARKNIDGFVTYKTFTMNPFERKTPNYRTGELEWAKDLAIPLTKNTKGFTIEINTLNGYTEIYNSKTAEEENKYFKIIDDEINDQIIIKPMKPASVFQH